MHGSHVAEDEPMAEMNLIPLIDIALTLLIILMVTTAFIHHPGVSLKLPETVTREGAPETNKDLTIAVTSAGALYVDGQERTPADIQQHLKNIAARSRNARILIKGDRDVAYARIMEVMDMVRQAGLSRVVLPTDPRLQQPALPPAAAAATVPPPPVAGSETPGIVTPNPALPAGAPLLPGAAAPTTVPGSDLSVGEPAVKSHRKKTE